VRNLSEAALQSYFQTEATQRSTQISLVASVATAWLQLAADEQRLQLARSTLASQRKSYDLIQRSHALGSQSGLALAQSQSTVDAARADAAAFDSQVEQDRNALACWPAPRRRRSCCRSRRPHHLHKLQAPRNPWWRAAAGAARRPALERAAAAPRRAGRRARAAREQRRHRRRARRVLPAHRAHRLGGHGEQHPVGPVRGGSKAWSFAPSISVPIFDGGANRANLRVAEAQQKIQLATYEKTVQTAFREVADALAERRTLAERLDAQRSLLGATSRSFELSQSLFRSGASSYLDVLDAQRAHYAAQQTLIGLQLTEQANRLTIYKALGGGWKES
jgi:multidrug efflux system outer membrane protein